MNDDSEGPVDLDTSADTDRAFDVSDLESSTLEKRYRRLLRLLPPGYRDVREQEMVDIFLQREYDADPENADFTAQTGRPDLVECLGVLKLATRVRWRGIDAPRRAEVRQHALQVAVLAGLSALAIVAVALLVGQVWFAITYPQYDAAGSIRAGSVGELLSSVRSWSFLLWIAAFVAVLVSRPRWAQAFSLIPLVSAFVGVILAPRTFGSWGLILAQIGLLVGLGGFSSGAPVPRRRKWIIAWVAGVIAVLAVTTAAFAFPRVRYPIGILVQDPTVFIWCAALAVIATIVLIRRLRGGSVGTGMLLGIATLGMAATVIRTGTLVDLIRFLPPDDAFSTSLLTAAIVQVVFVAGITLAVGFLGVRRFRRLPPVRYDTVTGA